MNKTEKRKEKNDVYMFWYAIFNSFIYWYRIFFFKILFSIILSESKLTHKKKVILYRSKTRNDLPCRQNLTFSIIHCQYYPYVCLLTDRL